MTRELLGVLAYGPNDIYSSNNYICFFDMSSLIIVQTDDPEKYIEKDYASKMSFLERMKDAFTRNSNNYPFSKEKMLQSADSFVFTRENVKDVSYNTVSNVACFVDVKTHKEWKLSIDYDENEEIITSLKRVFQEVEIIE